MSTAVVGLRNPQIVDIHTQLGCIEAVEGVFGIDEGSYAALLLGFGDGMDGERGLTRRLGTIDFDDATLGVAAHAQRDVERDGAGGNHLYVLDVLVAQFHDRAFAKVLLYLGHGSLERLEFALLCQLHFLVCFFLCHNDYSGFRVPGHRQTPRSMAVPAC